MNKENCCEDGLFSPKIKKYLGYAILFSILILSYSVFVSAVSYSNSVEPTSFRSFNVAGEGKITAIPDVARFSFGLVTDGGKDIAKLQKENTEKMNKAISYIKGEGVLDKDIKTENYSLTPKYQYFDCSRSVVYGNEDPKPCPPPEIVGYSINQRVSVKVRDFSKVGDILSGVVNNGANNVSELSFEIDDPSSIIEDARELAIKKAIDKAKKVARAGGFRVGRLISIEEGYQPYPVYRNYAKAEMLSMDSSGAGSLPAPQLEAGSQEVIVNITLRYEIK